MSSNQDAKSALDTPKLLVGLAILIAGIVGFYYFAEQQLIIRVVGLLVVVALSVGVMLTTVVGKATWKFVLDSRAELRRVVWPTRGETVQTTIIVLFMTLLMGVFLWMVDSLLLWLVKQLAG